MRSGDSRYVRQTALGEIGEGGQRALGDSTALVVGCGGLGSAQAELLARAGVGALVLIDDDAVAVHNLPRQLLYGEREARDRTPKALAAQRRIAEINSSCRVEALVARATRENVVDLVRRADVVLDATDELEARFLINDAAVKHGVPWVYGGVIETHGTAMAIRPDEGPCLRCVLEPPRPGATPSAETRGVLNTAVAWVAALQVTEALKILLGAPCDAHLLYSLDVWRGTVSSARALRRPDCPCCGQRRFEFLEGNG
jgi:molybdopterin-synthase adenylyltransferase